MSTGHLSDRMPAVAHGDGEWSAADRAHLSECEACRMEWELVTVGSRLGEGVGAHLDLNSVSDRVSQRIVSHQRVRISRVRKARWFVPLAAAAALIVFLGRDIQAPAGSGTEVTAVFLPELESLSEDELQYVFDVVPEAANPLEQGIPGVTDLDADELQRLLETLEG